MKHRASHVSGFRLDNGTLDPVSDVHGEECETGTDVFNAFVEALEAQLPLIAQEGLTKLEALEMEKGLGKHNVRGEAPTSFWDSVQESREDFSFSFAI